MTFSVSGHPIVLRSQQNIWAISCEDHSSNSSYLALIYNSVDRNSLETELQSELQADFNNQQNWLRWQCSRGPRDLFNWFDCIYWSWTDRETRGDNIWLAGPDLTVTELCLHHNIKTSNSIPPPPSPARDPAQNFCLTVNYQTKIKN